MLVSRVFKRLIRVGRLTVYDADGKSHVFGTGEHPAVTIRLHDRALHWRLALWPNLYAGEGYMDGRLTVENGTLYDFLDIVGRGYAACESDPLQGAAGHLDRLFRRLQQFNPPSRARRNAAHHYNLSDDLYRLFLDADLQYTCAYFRAADATIEEAQAQKKRHIAAKLLIRPDVRVLEMGCGWGGLALYLAGLGAQVTAVNVAEEQLKVARARAAQAGLGDRAQFHLRDYREQEGTFDRVAAIGILEHVGVNHYPKFFDCIRDRLTDDGVALVHTIGRSDGPGVTNPWIRKYIFPGGYFPALSELLPVIEQSGLWATDIEVLRLHYADTLSLWRQRFLANRAAALALYDERFCRMWEFYLAASEIAFRYMRCVVFQIQLAKRQDAVPLTRDYMYEGERTLAEAPSSGLSGRAA
jgi:cyclopropane-fatty-acyl-phospholipid synthase